MSHLRERRGAWVLWSDPAPGTRRSWRQRERLLARLDGRGEPTLRELAPLLVALVLAAVLGTVLLVCAGSVGGPPGVLLVALLYLGGLVRLVLWRGAVVRRRRGNYTAAELDRLGELQLPAVVLALLRRDGWRASSAPYQGLPRILGERAGRELDVVFRLGRPPVDSTAGGRGPALLRTVGTTSHDGVIRLVVALPPFPRDDILWASRQGVHLVDGALIHRWAAGESVQYLLGLGPLPRRDAS